MYHSGSFRDHESRILSNQNGAILRVLSEAASEWDRTFRESGLMDRLIHDGLVVENWRKEEGEPPEGWAALVESKTLPFVSYPYEWSFSMLKDAALLTLDLTERTLRHNFILRDASAYNVFFEGAKPTFIDVTSFQPYKEGMSWAAYRQFVEQFLAPLMLEAHKGIPFQQVLRGNLSGLSVTKLLAPLFSWQDWMRPGVFTDIKLRSIVERSSEKMETSSRKNIRQAHPPKEILFRNMRRLKKVVTKLQSRIQSNWSNYTEQNSYDQESMTKKREFLQDAIKVCPQTKIAWDVGANTGAFSRLLSEYFDWVVAMDQDPGVIEQLYGELKAEKAKANIIPLVMDLLEPSPPQGWRNRERQSLFERGKPDLAVFLALIHHLCLSENVPISEFVDLICDLSPMSVVEFVDLNDSMSRKIVATKTEFQPDYTIDTFRSEVRRRGLIKMERPINATRTLFLVESRTR